LKLVPKATLPDDLSWAALNPNVAGAFAGFVQVVEEAGTAVLPEQVRLLVSERVQAWNGEAMGISRRWVEDAVVEIEEAHRAAARLALLTALASYQVDSSIVEVFQAQYPEDAQLIAATAWASFTAARRVSVWIARLRLPKPESRFGAYTLTRSIGGREHVKENRLGSWSSPSARRDTRLCAWNEHLMPVPAVAAGIFMTGPVP
jgi:hypothetical protein